MNQYILNCDASFWPEDETATFGAVLQRKTPQGTTNVATAFGPLLGATSSNGAECSAIQEGVALAMRHVGSEDELTIRTDSEGAFEMMLERCDYLDPLRCNGVIVIPEHIPRKANGAADRLCRKARRRWLSKYGTRTRGTEQERFEKRMNRRFGRRIAERYYSRGPNGKPKE